MSLVFLKLGGSLITDKHRAYTARREVIARLASEVRNAIERVPDMQLLIGHGSGSFGHWAARPYGTRRGVRTPAQWRGYATVAAVAARLNRIVTDEFLAADVPVLSLQPSASARCRDGTVEYLDTHPIYAALKHGLVPLVYGDVALDSARGGTIISTEDIFVYLAAELRPSRILLMGEVAGVLTPAGEVIPRISPNDLERLWEVLGGSDGVDVTGGMADKVTQMAALVSRMPGLEVRIFGGKEAGLLERMLTAPIAAGTVVRRG